MRDALKLLAQQCDADGPKRRDEPSVVENAGDTKSRISHPVSRILPGPSHSAVGAMVSIQLPQGKDI